MLKVLDIELLEAILLIIPELHDTTMLLELLCLIELVMLGLCWLLDIDLLQEALILLEHELPLETDTTEFKLLWLLDSELLETILLPLPEQLLAILALHDLLGLRLIKLDIELLGRDLLAENELLSMFKDGLTQLELPETRLLGMHEE